MDKFLLREIVSICSPVIPVCLKVTPPTVIDLTATPAAAGSSFHLSLKVISPVPPVVRMFLPAESNFAPIKGEDERILNSLFTSSPSPSYKLITLPSALTFVIKFLKLSPS